MSIVSGIIPIGVKSRGLGLRRSFRLVYKRETKLTILSHIIMYLGKNANHFAIGKKYKERRQFWHE